MAESHLTTLGRALFGRQHELMAVRGGMSILRSPLIEARRVSTPPDAIGTAVQGVLSTFRVQLIVFCAHLSLRWSSVLLMQLAGAEARTAGTSHGM
jgi:hypothetical protein